MAHYGPYGDAHVRRPCRGQGAQGAGFEEARAEAVVMTVGGAMTGNVATKADISDLRAEMAEQFSVLYRHLWIMAIGIVGFTASLTVALVKLIL